VNGKTMGENVRRARIEDADVIRTYKKPMLERAGFKVLSGNLFDSAIMKLSVISEEFRNRYLINPKDPNAFEGKAVVFDGPEDYHHRIDDPKLRIDEHTMLFVRGTGPIGYPGSCEVVNMQPPAALIKKGITSLPCIGDGRQDAGRARLFLSGHRAHQCERRLQDVERGDLWPGRVHPKLKDRR
jgi:dihydroxy-acid dehydratase